MTIPSQKRIKINSEQELNTWLAKHPDQDNAVMLVTFKEPFDPRHVSRAQVGDALEAHGWVGGLRYTLNAGLLGHVISKRRD